MHYISLLSDSTSRVAVSAPDLLVSKIAAPHGADLNANIRTTLEELSPSNWISKVSPRGTWDYRGNDGQDRFNAFTQLNYGATGRVFYPSQVLLRVAGGLQMISDTANTPPAGTSSPLAERPYGDAPEDTTYIELGILYYETRYLMGSK